MKKRIDALVDALGAAEKPSSTDIRNELVPIGVLVESLENGQALSEKEARITDLEMALEQSNADFASLQVELQAATAEIEEFRAEQKRKQAQEKKELPEIQFEILKRLPSEHGGIPWKLNEIRYIAEVPMDETEIHVEWLRRAGLIKSQWHHNAEAWNRTIAGNEYVLARRLADEQPDEEKEEESRFDADLPDDVQEALLLIARNENGIGEFEFAQRCGVDAMFIFEALNTASFAYSETNARGFRYDRNFEIDREGRNLSDGARPYIIPIPIGTPTPIESPNPRQGYFCLSTPTAALPAQKVSKVAAGSGDRSLPLSLPQTQPAPSYRLSGKRSMSSGQTGPCWRSAQMPRRDRERSGTRNPRASS